MTITPLRRVLAIHSLLPMILPFAVVLLLGFFWLFPHLKKDAGEKQLQLAMVVGKQVESYLETGAVIVRAAAAMPRGDHQHLSSLLGSTDTLSSLYEISPVGAVSLAAFKKELQIKHLDQIGLDLSRNPFYRDLQQSKKPRWSETFLSVISGGLVAAYGVPGIGTTVIGEVDLTHLTTFLRQISTEKDLLVLIVDHNGQVVADNNGIYTAQQLNIGNIPLVSAGIKSDAPTTGRIHFAGSDMTASIIEIRAIDWHVLVAQTDASLFHSLRTIALIVLASGLISLASGMLASFYLARKMASRFDSIATHADNVTRGGETGNWPLSNITEFNQLSSSLHTMAIALRQQDLVLRESEERYRLLVNNIPLGVSLIDREHRIVMTNRTQAEMFGREPESFAGRYCYEEFEKRDATCRHCPGADGVMTNEVADVETESVRDDGSRFTVHIRTVPLRGASGECTGFIEVAEDITARKRAEEENVKLEQQLLHAQKLESLGVLAGGIAHDFNNILMAIIGNADLALMRLNKESPAVENLKRIEQAALRAADLAKQMLAYSGKGAFVVDNIDLNLLLKEMLHMLEVSISKKAVMRLNLHQSLPPVEADATQMRQIIMNLVINASEAIGDRSGVIAITTGCMECDRNYLKDVWLDENLAAGRYVYLEISDTGCGMATETLSKLFDPFFTTKFTGRGLGMSAVLGIVRGHKGAIKVYSEPEKGTSFKILLPASEQPKELFTATSIVNEWRGRGTVLLVDDEEAIRNVEVEMLEELGFTVITAADGREAIELFKRTPNIALVLLDLTMPHMDGEQCFRVLRQMDPMVKVIMSSGYNEQEVTQKFVGKGLAGFIQKPYPIAALEAVIRKAL